MIRHPPIEMDFAGKVHRRHGISHRKAWYHCYRCPICKSETWRIANFVAGKDMKPPICNGKYS